MAMVLSRRSFIFFSPPCSKTFEKFCIPIVIYIGMYFIFYDDAWFYKFKSRIFSWLLIPDRVGAFDERSEIRAHCILRNTYLIIIPKKRELKKLNFFWLIKPEQMKMSLIVAYVVLFILLLRTDTPIIREPQAYTTGNRAPWMTKHPADLSPAPNSLFLLLYCTNSLFLLLFYFPNFLFLLFYFPNFLFLLLLSTFQPPPLDPPPIRSDSRELNTSRSDPSNFREPWWWDWETETERLR